MMPFYSLINCDEISGLERSQITELFGRPQSFILSQMALLTKGIMTINL